MNDAILPTEQSSLSNNNGNRIKDNGRYANISKHHFGSIIFDFSSHVRYLKNVGNVVQKTASRNSNIHNISILHIFKFSLPKNIAKFSSLLKVMRIS